MAFNGWLIHYAGSILQPNQCSGEIVNGYIIATMEERPGFDFVGHQNVDQVPSDRLGRRRVSQHRSWLDEDTGTAMAQR